MRLLTRYIFRQTAGALLIIVLSLSGIVWISLALRQLSVVTTDSQSAFTLMKMTTLGLPTFMAVIAPVALLISTIHVLNRLSSDSELIIASAAGATVWAIARPLLLLAAIVAAAVAFVNHLAMPWSARVLRDLIIEMRTDLVTQVLQPGRFTSPEKGLTMHIRDRKQNGLLVDLLIHDNRKPEQSRSYLAESGSLIEQDGKTYLVMSKGHILIKTAQDEPASVVAFNEMVVDLEQFEPSRGGPMERKPREYFMDELLAAKSAATDRGTLGMLTAEIHDRMTSPLYAFVFVLIPVIMLGRPQTVREIRSSRTAAAFGISTGTRVAALAINNYVAMKPEMAFLFYLVPLGACGACLALLIADVSLPLGALISWRRPKQGASPSGVPALGSTR